MRFLVRSSFVMGLSAALVPVPVQAQSPAPAGYAPASPSPSPSAPAMMGMPGKLVPVQPVMAVQAAPAPHTHKFRTVCANCMKKQQVMPAERIIACAHSKNGVCPTCQALLAMPGTVTMGASAASPAPAEAPGRAMVSHQPSPSGAQYAAQSAPMSAVYDPSSTPEPAPIGVMQTNYAQPGAAMAGPAAPTSIPTASSIQPGHALVTSGANPAPFQHKPTSSKNPHVLGHIFGFSGVGSEWRDQRAQKKTQAHASIPYNNEGTTINELPASMVYDRQH